MAAQPAFQSLETCAIATRLDLGNHERLGRATHINVDISAIAAIGLDVEFNSLDTQREASKAFSASQHAEELGITYREYTLAILERDKYL